MTDILSLLNLLILQNILVTKLLGIESIIELLNDKQSKLIHALLMLVITFLLSLLCYGLFYYLLSTDISKYSAEITTLLLVFGLCYFGVWLAAKLFKSFTLNKNITLYTLNSAIFGQFLLIYFLFSYKFINVGIVETITVSMIGTAGYLIVLGILMFLLKKIKHYPIPETFKGLPVILIILGMIDLIFRGYIGVF